MTIRTGWAKWRSATVAEWEDEDPVVPFRTIAVAIDTHRLKAGDGTSTWSELPYLEQGEVQVAVDAAVAALVDSAPGALDTLNELAAALGDDSNFAATITTALAAKATATALSTETTNRIAGDAASVATAATDATTKANAAQAAAISAAATDATTKANAAQAASQPLDSDLTAIAALSTTSYGRNLLALADAAAGRTALGLGSAAVAASSAFEVAGAAAAAQAASQPLDSDLTAIAALSTTSYGRAFLALANAAAGRTALGLGTAAVTDSTAYASADRGVALKAADSKTVFDAATAPTPLADPSTLSGLEIWVDAAYTANVALASGDFTVGGPVSSISSASGSRAWVQATGAAQPIWTPNLQGGLGGLVFDGVDDQLQRAAVTTALDRAAAAGQTTFVVGGFVTLGTPSLNLLRHAYTSGTTSPNTATGLIYSTVGSTAMLTAQSRRASGATNAVAPADTNNHIFGLVWGTDDTLTLRVDGKAGPPMTGATGTPTGHLRSNLGADSNSSHAGFANCRIFEVLIYSRQLTAAEIKQVEKYLASKWGFTVDHATPVPTLVSPPADSYDGFPVLSYSPQWEQLVLSYVKATTHTDVAGKAYWHSGKPGAWSAQTLLYEGDGTGDVKVAGAGVDSKGRNLAIVRDKGTPNAYYLKRFEGGGWRTLQTISGAATGSSGVWGFPRQVEYIASAALGLIWWHSDSGYGVLVSTDDWFSYTTVIIGSATASTGPFEVRFADLGGGKILGIGRTQGALADPLKQITIDTVALSPLTGANWTVADTNITDSYHDCAVVLPRGDTAGTVDLYYGSRAHHRISHRIATTAAFTSPTSWSAADVVCGVYCGANVDGVGGQDGGQPSGVRLNGENILTFYGGAAPSCGVYVMRHQPAVT